MASSPDPDDAGDGELGRLLPDQTPIGSVPEMLPLGRFHFFLLSFGFTTHLAQGMIYEVLPLIVTSTEKALKINPTQAQLLVAALNAGAIPSAILGGLLADRIGRKKVIVISNVTGLVFSLLGPAASNFGYLVGLSAAKGFCIGAFDAAVYTLIIELLPMRRRGLLSSVWRIGWPTGGLIGALLCHLLLPSYRMVLLLSSLGLLASAAFLPFISESPRFLDMAGRPQEARRTLETIIRWNRADDPERYNLDMTRSATTTTTTNPTPPPANGCGLGLRAIQKLFQGRLLKFTLLLFVAWSCLSFASPGIRSVGPAYLEKNKKLNANNDVQTVQAIGSFCDFLGIVVAALIIDLSGRRWLALGGLCVAAAGALLIAPMPANAVAALAVVIGLQQLGQALVWPAIDVYTGECFPTVVRATASGFMRMVSALISAISPVVGGAMVSKSNSAVIFLCAGIYVLGIVPLVLLGVDTVGKKLEDDLEVEPDAKAAARATG